ncbi:Glycosyltransferase [hydrothermal vent metagenome]|uniref:Glycosyltransferase n=1 Tax=hydrothermal vent metagenome TaxID=652676 RepID=A0A3B0Z8F5_9ZZZZ
MADKKLTVVQMLPALDAGGVERGTLELGKYLTELGHHSIVISDGGRMLPDLIAQGSTHYCWDVGNKRLRTLRWIRKVRQLFQEIKPDIVHVRSRLPAWIGYQAWKKLPKNDRPHLVTTVHGPYSPGWYSSVMTRGERVIAISEMILEYITTHYKNVDKDLIRIIYRGASREQYYKGYRPDEEWLNQWHQTYPQLKNKYVVALPGRITRRKGHVDFIQVIAGLKAQGIDVVGLIVGEAHKHKQHFVQELKQLMSVANVEHDIIFTGHRNDLKNIMAVSDVVLSLALDPEAFGRVTIESLSLGIPTAGYDHGGVKEQLAKVLPSGAIAIGDTAAMTALLVQWYQQAPEIEDEHPFTLENMLSRTLAVYHELCHS